MSRTHVRILGMATVVAIALGAVAGRTAFAAEAAADDPWLGLVVDVFKGRPLEDGNGLLALDVPYRAEDAAIVPLTVRATLPAGDARRVTAITVVIDQNRAPVAAIFELGPHSGASSISTRVRIDSYTNVHAVAELSDGKLYAVASYVAAGGCSAPAQKNADEAKAGLGQMKFRQVRDTRRRAGWQDARGADHDPPCEQFRAADGPGDAALCSGLFRARIEELAG